MPVKTKDEITVKVQNMFPNCEKYDKCCKDNKKFWDDLEKGIKVTEYKKTPFRIENVKLKTTKPPIDFENIVISRLDN